MPPKKIVMKIKKSKSKKNNSKQSTVNTTIQNVNTNVNENSLRSEENTVVKNQQGRNIEVIDEINDEHYEVKDKLTEEKIILPVEEIIEMKDENGDENVNRIKPKEWVYIDKKKFLGWINETFLPYQIRADNKQSDKFELRKYQKFVRDYLQFKSPYRGILLFHGLGSGKTCSAVAIAENLKTHYNIIIMLPASLKGNFIKDIKKCGNSSYKVNPELISQKYSFVSYNAANTLEQIDRLGSLDNHVIIIEEVHNLVSMMMSEGVKGRAIYKRLMEAKNVKIIALSGTPIINTPFEVALLFNILRGPIELLQFSIEKIRTEFDRDLEYFKTLILDQDFVEYVDISFGNRTISMKFSEEIKTYNSDFMSYIDKVKELGRDNGVDLFYITCINIPLFPDGGEDPKSEIDEEFRRYFVEETKDGDKLKNLELMKRRLIGLISYYRGGNPKFYPRLNPEVIEKVEMSDYQFKEYEAVRDIERRAERGVQISSKQKKKKDGPKSFFRVYSREFSNFVFPDEIVRPFKSKAVMLRKVKKRKDDGELIDNKEIAEAEKELIKESSNAIDHKKMSKDEKDKIKEALDKLSAGGKEYLSDEALAIYSPKMKKVLENIEKSKGIVLVYSQFRSVEGIEVFVRILEEVGYHKWNDEKHKCDGDCYGVYSGEEDPTEREEMIKKAISYDNRYGKHIKIILISAAGAEGLDLKNVRQIHLLEPYWNEVRMRQVIGRGIRLNSHADLPDEDRDVSVFRYLSVLSPSQRSSSKEPLSTDEAIQEIAIRKWMLTEPITQLMKEVAVDCVLFAVDNEKNLKCMTFGEDTNGLSYVPKLGRDLVHVKSDKSTKDVEIKLMLFYMDKDGFLYVKGDDSKKKPALFGWNDKTFKTPIKPLPSSLEKVRIDVNSGRIYDFSAAKQGNLILLGKVDEDKGRIERE